MSYLRSPSFRTRWKTQRDMFLLPHQVVLLCDNLGTVHVIKRSSAIPVLARLIVGQILSAVSAGVGKNCFPPCDVRAPMLSFVMWMVPVAVGLTLTVSCFRLTCSGWLIRLLLCYGFQVDRAQSFVNFMSVDRAHRMPFNSCGLRPFLSGITQSWSHFINWCNPPFVVIDCLISMSRRQRTRAAVVVPSVS